VTRLSAVRPGFGTRQGLGFFSSQTRAGRLWVLSSLLFSVIGMVRSRV